MTLDESHKLSVRQALLRDSIYILVSAAGLIYLIIQLISSDLSTTELINSYDDFAGIVSLVWVVIELLSMLTNDKRRAIHDFIAASVVIKTDKHDG